MAIVESEERVGSFHQREEFRPYWVRLKPSPNLYTIVQNGTTPMHTKKKKRKKKGNMTRPYFHVHKHFTWQRTLLYTITFTNDRMYASSQ